MIGRKSFAENVHQPKVTNCSVYWKGLYKRLLETSISMSQYIQLQIINGNLGRIIVCSKLEAVKKTFFLKT